jgi:hypothetical protein
MFGRAAHILDRNAVIGLAIIAAILLLAGLLVAVDLP